MPVLHWPLRTVDGELPLRFTKYIWDDPVSMEALSIMNAPVVKQPLPPPLVDVAVIFCVPDGVDEVVSALFAL